MILNQKYIDGICLKKFEIQKLKNKKKKIHNIDINKLYLSSFDNSFRLLEEKKDDEDLWQDDIPHNFVGVEIFDKELNIFYLSENTSYNYETDQKLINEKEKKYLINEWDSIIELNIIDKNIKDIKVI